MILLGIASITLDVERSRSRVWCSIDPGYGSASLEDGGVNRSSLSASLKTAQNPNGEPFPAYHSGNSWDEPPGKAGSGKKFCHSVILGTDFAAQPCIVATITPVMHLCMAVHGIGFKVSSRASTQQKKLLEVCTRITDWVANLFWIGVFSRVTGVTCARNILGDRVKVTSLAVLANEGKAERSKSN